jgi:uncharacterized membrane protein YsdA (DUF1294 family)
MAGPEQRPGVVGALLRGLSTSVTGNAQAFGFSVTVTVTYGAVSNTEGDPSRWELLGFAVAAVAAFSLLNLFVFALLRSDRQSAEVERARLIGTATDFFAVAGAVGAAIGATELVHGWAAWLLAPFVAGLAYVLVQAIELTVGRSKAEEN